MTQFDIGCLSVDIDWKLITAGIFLTAWIVGFIVYILVRRKHD